MSWNNNNDNHGKNPWGRGPERPRNPWGHGGGGSHTPPPGGPDFDDMIRQMRDSLSKMFPGAPGGVKIILLGVAILLALWLSSGFYIVNPNESGVIQRFGAWDRTKTTPGLGYHLPWPIESIETVNVTEIRRMEIGFTEVFGRNGGTGKRDIPEESLMLTSDANIVNLDFVVLWNISSAERFLFNIEEPENTIKKVAESAIREVVGQTPMFPIITQDRSRVAQSARGIMTENLEQYEAGVNITQVLIQEAEVHPDVQDAFQDVQSARQDAIEVQNRAQAYREDILPRARGEAIKLQQEAEAYMQSTVARARGDADRFNAVYEAYLTGQNVTRERLYLEMMEEVLQNAQKIIMDNENGGIVPYLPLNEMRPSQIRPSAGNTGNTQ